MSILEVMVTCHLYQYVIEIEIDSMKNFESQSWIVISKDMNKYVNELPEEAGESIHYEEMVTGTGKPVAAKIKEQPIPTLPSFSTMVVPIDQWKWKDILVVDHVDERSVSFNRGLYLETDGAMEWNILLLMVRCR